MQEAKNTIAEDSKGRNIDTSLIRPYDYHLYRGREYFIKGVRYCFVGSENGAFFRVYNPERLKKEDSRSPIRSRAHTIVQEEFINWDSIKLTGFDSKKPLHSELISILDIEKEYRFAGLKDCGIPIRKKGAGDFASYRKADIFFKTKEGKPVVCEIIDTSPLTDEKLNIMEYYDAVFIFIDIREVSDQIEYTHSVGQCIKHIVESKSRVVTDLKDYLEQRERTLNSTINGDTYLIKNSKGEYKQDIKGKEVFLDTIDNALIWFNKGNAKDHIGILKTEDCSLIRYVEAVNDNI